MNAVSSRSHSVFMMFITGYHEASQTRLTGECEYQATAAWIATVPAQNLPAHPQLFLR